jgi:hypothetical protein
MIYRHPDGIAEWMALLDDPDRRPLAIMAQPRAASQSHAVLRSQ